MFPVYRVGGRTKDSEPRGTRRSRVRPPITRSVREERKGLIDLVWRSCLSAGLNNINKGFPKASLEHNEAITLLYCSFSSHGPIRRTDQSQYHFGIETPAGWLLRRKVVPILPTAIPDIIARSRESRRTVPSHMEKIGSHYTIATP